MLRIGPVAAAKTVISQITSKLRIKSDFVVNVQKRNKKRKLVENISNFWEFQKIREYFFRSLSY
jgi:hypothetical protein